MPYYILLILHAPDFWKWAIGPLLLYILVSVLETFFLSSTAQLNKLEYLSLAAIFSLVEYLCVRPESTRALCYQTFYGCNLRMFIISYSVCPRQASPAYSNVCE